MRTESVQDILSAGAIGEKYDQAMKRIWRNREILAPLLQVCVKEFEGESVEDIMRYIDADSISDDTPVSDLPPQIVEMATEMNSTTERPVTFDMKFVAKNPKLSTENVMVRIHILVDFQNKFYPTDSDGKTYIVEDRASYYVVRGLSSQLGTVTNKTNYRELEKVISIWIVSEDVPKRLQNTVSRYHMVKDDVIGKADIPKQHYDKMEMVVIRRGEAGKSVAPVFEYLDAVFTSDLETMDKFTPASGNPEIAKEVADMPGMSQAILERGMQQGVQQGMQQGEQSALVQSIQNLMDTLKLTLEQAMDALKIPSDQRSMYAGMVNKE